MKPPALEHPEAAPPASAPPWRPWAIALAVWLLLAVATAASLWQLRAEALQGQSRELGLLSLALADELERGLRGTQEGLGALRDEVRDGRLPLTPDAGAAALRTRADLMPLVSKLWILDGRGRALAASDPVAAPPLSSFGRQFLADPRGRVALSGRLAAPGDEALVALALRVDETALRGSRWIVAAVPASALLGAFGAAASAGDASMAVLQPDGTPLAVANDPGALLTSGQLATGDRATGLRRFRAGQQRLVATRTVAPYGLTLTLARDPEVTLLGWRQTAEAAALAMGLLLAVLAAAVHFAVLAARRRTEAERAAQAQRVRASRLEALGTLAGGVAHDFNNVLGAIVGYGEMARDAARPGSAQARHLDRVLQAALRGKALVERIVAFSRGGARTSTRFALEPVVEEVLALLSASLRPGVVLERVLEAPEACVRGDPTRAFEAIMNLCTNAMQAMPQGGMLSVHLRRLQVEERKVLSHSSVDAGSYVLLAVRDQGVGITPEVAEHLFEPFFTTRSAQSGTGLGLAVVHGVVAEFGGAIDVQGTPGQGACFTLYLPQALQPADSAAPVPAPAAAGQGRRVLVVDDEAALAGMTGEMLDAMGYRTFVHTDPVAALEALRADPGGFDALVTDEVMAGLSGTALAQAARRSAPGLPVLLVSGYGGAALAQRAAAAGVARVLAKPLQHTELAHALAQLLREAPALHLSSGPAAAPHG